MQKHISGVQQQQQQQQAMNMYMAGDPNLHMCMLTSNPYATVLIQPQPNMTALAFGQGVSV